MSSAIAKNHLNAKKEEESKRKKLKNRESLEWKDSVKWYCRVYPCVVIIQDLNWGDFRELKCHMGVQVIV